MEGSAEAAGWRAIYDRALRAFPGVRLSLADFVAHAARVGAPDPASSAHADDLFLACACASGDPQAIAALERRYFPGARAALARLARGADFVDEALQELRAKLFLAPDPRIASYGARGPLQAWIRVAATRLAIDMLRASAADLADRPLEEDPIHEVDLGPEVRLLREVYQESFRATLTAALRALSSEDRNLLRRHLVDRLTLQEIAVPYGVHQATIARRLSALRDAIAESVRQGLAERHRDQGGGTSLESLARAIRSEIDLSLSRLLAPDAGSGPGSGSAPSGAGGAGGA
jgi:RNA polymerase sigma-70 factor (ECF subfamily)